MAEHFEMGLKMSEDEFRAQAVYSDETKQFRVPAEPSSADSVEISIRVGKGCFTAIFLCTSEREFFMEKIREDGVFAYYRTVLPPAKEKTAYFFRLQYGDQYGFYTKYGYFHEYRTDGWFEILRDYKTPDWAKGAVMYQIYPDRFCNGDKSNDVQTGEYTYLGRTVERVEDWDSLPEPTDIHRFYGGDLQGIMDKLDYLQELGIEALYLNPIFVSPSNHKYDIQDYDHIDPHFGRIVREKISPENAGTDNALYIARTTDLVNLEASDALFAELVQAAHERGIRVIIDGVFNHCGAFHKWLDRENLYGEEGKGAYLHAKSPYRNYFYWQEGNNYDGWWGHANHPKLNAEGSVALRNALIAIGRKWVSPPYNADGWRLDVAADLGRTADFNHRFWSVFRKAVKDVSQDKLILAEHYGDASPWLQGDQWDSIMNYDAFMEPLTWFLTGVSKHSTERRDDLYNNADAFWGGMIYQMSRLPAQAIQVSMNELSNHDHSRFLTRTNRRTGRLENEGAEAAGENVDKAVMREAVLFQMTWPGAPTVYYGDEAGMVGWTDPDNRRTYPWGKEDGALIAFHKKLISLRKEHQTLRSGSLRPLYGGYGVIAYGRFDETGNYVVALNNSDEGQVVSIPVWLCGVAPESCLHILVQSNRSGFDDFPVPYPVMHGMMETIMPPKSCMVWKEVRDDKQYHI